MFSLSPGALIASSLYVTAMGLCLRAASTSLTARRIWLLLALLLAGLACGRFFDLGNLLTELGRGSALEHGWYRRRRPIQFAAICAFAIAAAIFLGWFLRRARSHSVELRVAIAATVALVCFAAVRTASWHYLDRALGIHVGALRLSWLVELLLLGVDCVAAARASALPALNRPERPSRR